MCFLNAKENPGNSLKKIEHVNHKNSNKANNNDNDVLYNIEYYDLDNDQPDNILSSFDLEESDENKCVF